VPTDFDAVLRTIDAWGADHSSAAVVGPRGVIDQHGPTDHRYRWASVTKLATALAVLSAVDDGILELDEPAGPPGSTIRHLLAHASGLGFEGEAALARPGTRRIYSNAGFDLLGSLLSERSGRAIAVTLADRLLAPLGMAGAELIGRPSEGLHGPLADAIALAGELLRPAVLQKATAAEAWTVQFPGLKGLLPGVGTFEPLDWGLGPEIRGSKAPHWTGGRNSPATFGPFGGAATFVGVDPAIDRALVCLTDREFGPWALDAWPRLSDAVIEVQGGGTALSPG
jgi:CubicO group peptidase (beta-lactamase class C family)